MFCGSQQPDCTAWKQNDTSTPPVLKANPDIAGPGVVGASLATATLSIVLSLAHILPTYWDDAEMDSSMSS